MKGLVWAVVILVLGGAGVAVLLYFAGRPIDAQPLCGEWLDEQYEGSTLLRSTRLVLTDDRKIRQSLDTGLFGDRKKRDTVTHRNGVYELRGDGLRGLTGILVRWTGSLKSEVWSIESLTENRLVLLVSAGNRVEYHRAKEASSDK